MEEKIEYNIDPAEFAEEKKSERLTIRLDESHRQKLDVILKRNNISAGNFIRRCISSVYSNINKKMPVSKPAKKKIPKQI